jgi:hypothetical protein
MGGGYNLIQGETAMCNHTKNPNSLEKPGEYQGQQVTNQAETSTQASKKQKLHANFNLVKSIKGKQVVICAALIGEQARSLVNSPLLIKFAGMEGVK